MRTPLAIYLAASLLGLAACGGGSDQASVATAEPAPAPAPPTVTDPVPAPAPAPSPPSSPPTTPIAIGARQITSTLTAYLSTSAVFTPNVCMTQLIVRANLSSSPLPFPAGVTVGSVAVYRDVDAALVWTGQVTGQGMDSQTGGLYALARGCAPYGVPANTNVTAVLTVEFGGATQLLTTGGTALGAVAF